MGLSNYSPQEKFSMLEVLSQLLALGKELQNDPALESAAKTAFALAEREKTKAEESRKSIAKYEELVAENKKQLEEIANSRSELEKERDDIDKAMRNLNEVKVDLDKNERRLKEIHLQQQQKQSEIERADAELERQKNIHATNVQQFNANKKEFEKYEIELKAKADKLKQLTEGL